MLPSILNDSTSFWLDFAGSRLPETSKIEEKLRLEISVFFKTEKKCRRPVFPDFGVHFDVSFGARGCKKMLFFFLEGSFSQFGLAFCFQGRIFSLRAHFFSPKPCVLRWCFSKSSVSFESEAKSAPNMLKKIPEMISFLVWVWNPCGNIPLSLFRYRRHVHVTSNGFSLFFSSLRFSSLRFSSLKPWPSISTL